MTATERLHRDVWPAEAYAPQLTPAPVRARVFITDRRVLVWTLDATGAPILLLESAVSEPPQRDRGSTRGNQVALDTEAGPLYVTKATGCGCGSPLRALAPPVGW